MRATSRTGLCVALCSRKIIVADSAYWCGAMSDGINGTLEHTNSTEPCTSRPKRRLFFHNLVCIRQKHSLILYQPQGHFLSQLLLTFTTLLPSKQTLRHGYLQTGTASIRSRRADGPSPLCWPQRRGEDLRIHHSSVDTLKTAAELIEQAAMDLNSTHPAVCVIEDVSAEWAAELGVAWTIPVQFFVEHLTGPNVETDDHMLRDNRPWGLPDGLHSTTGNCWATMRGIVEYGPSPGSTVMEMQSISVRRSGCTPSGRFWQHTNVSWYKVHEKLGE